MVFEPETEQDIQQSIEDRLRGRIEKLTNFVTTSFNQTFLNAFAQELREYEIRLLAAQLSGWVDYAGGPITEDDLEELGLTGFDALDALNSYMDDAHLDRIGALVGVQRDTGTRATGTVRISTFESDTPVPDETTVTTAPDASGNTLSFTVDLGPQQTVTPDEQNNPQNYVDVDVIAQEEGTEYNGAQITQFVSPPPGVTGVQNQTVVDGGEGPETNDELRERIKRAIFETSGGGTVAGIEGFIETNVDGVGDGDVFLDEFLTDNRVDVIVSGGVEQDVLDAIETARPAGIPHDLVRPTTYVVGVDIEVRGTDVDTQRIKTRIENYLSELELGENLIRDELIYAALDADENVTNVLALNTRIVSIESYLVTFDSNTDVYSLPVDRIGRVDSEDHLYVSGTDAYEVTVPDVLDNANVSITGQLNGQQHTFTKDTDYEIIDTNSDGNKETVDWSIGGDSPDADTIFTISYDIDVSQTGDGITSVIGILNGSEQTFVEGTDYDEVDSDGDTYQDAIDWGIGGDNPDDGTDFTIDATVHTDLFGDYIVNEGEEVQPEPSEITVAAYN
jgi:hypothetical protein